MTMDVNGATSTNRITMASLGPTGSLQIIFAKLQLELAQSAKSQALDRMDSIKATQEEQKHVAALLNQARQLKSDCETPTTKGMKETYYKYETGEDGKEKAVSSYTTTTCVGGKVRQMGNDMVHYMQKNNLAYPNNDKDNILGIEEWDVAIKSLEDRLELLGTDTQQQMVYVQDYMGQYNSYLQGANTQISESNRTLGALAKGQ